MSAQSGKTLMSLQPDPTNTNPSVAGAPYGKMDSKVATAPKTQGQSKDKDKFNKRIKL